MTTSQNYQNITFKHVRHDVTFLFAPKIFGCVPPLGSLMGKQNPVPSCYFKGRPHMFRNVDFETEFDKPRFKNSRFDLKVMGFKVGPSFSWVKRVVSKSYRKQRFSTLQKHTLGTL
jgi:hypothetical protein